MKTRTMFYTGLGYATFRIGKLLARRRMKSALHGRTRGGRAHLGRPHAR